MYIVIIGAGGIGGQLVHRILKDGNHNVVVIDKDPLRCEEIAHKYDAVAINADTTQEETLNETEISKADVLVATTDKDAINLMVVSLAKNQGVKHLVSVVNQEESKPMFLEKGVKMVRSPDLVMARHLFKAIKHPNIKDHMAVGEHAEIFRLPVQKDSKLSGKNILQACFPKNSLIVAIERKDKFIISNDDVELFEGDTVTVLSHIDQVDKVVNLFYE